MKKIKKYYLFIIFISCNNVFCEKITVNYFGLEINLELENKILNYGFLNKVSKIEECNKIIESLGNPFFSQIDSISIKHNIRDYAIICLFNKIKIEKYNKPIFDLLMYHYFKQNNYNFILYISNIGSVIPAFVSENPLSTKFTTYKNKDYYYTDFKQTQKQIIYFEQSKGKKKISFQEIPNFPITNTLDTYLFNNCLTNEMDSIRVVYNSNYLAYYAELPQFSNYNFYAIIKPSLSFENSIFSEINSRINSYSQLDKVKFLLSFVQQLPYFSNDATFTDKFFFPEEALYYKKTDCEDRSFLLSYLIRNFTSINNIIIGYKGHVNIGIQKNQLKENLENADCFNIENNKCCLIAETTDNSKIGKVKFNYQSKVVKYFEVPAVGTVIKRK